jgi:VIT1/CCC1 family predicted Fe2+/Mn2+ transporter
MRAFVQAHLDPTDRLGEVVFSLIMSLGFIGACRLELAEADNRAMLIGVLGCNLAWAIVDGVMYVFASLFERGLRRRLIRDVTSASTEEEALKYVADEFDERVESMTTPEERKHLYTAMMKMAHRSTERVAKLRRKDILGGIAVSLLIVVSTLPVIAPFALIHSPLTAIRVASGVALSLLFIVGCWWGHMVGANPWRIGSAVTGIGIVLVCITVALGG